MLLIKSRSVELSRMLGSVRCIQTLLAVLLWKVTLRSDDPISLLLLTRLTPDSSDA
jgi:hypothetical protein